MKDLYLDNAATTPISPEVREAMLPWLGELWGNPSSRHRLGVRAREAVDRAREQVARAVEARPLGVHFTSGGTEANNLAVQGAARRRAGRGKHVLVGPTEHPSVREAARSLEAFGFEIETMRLTPAGELDLEAAAAALRPDTVLVTQMLVSNELGTVYPLAELTRLVRERSPHAHVHVDAVQGLGKVELSIEELGVDSLAVSAHKLHGPQGAGALIAREGAQLDPIVRGGGQENALRPGTQGVPGIVGFGEAAAQADRHLGEARARCAAVRAGILAGLQRIEGARAVLAGTSVPNILAVELPGPPAEVWLHHLEELGVYVSVGSACQTNAGGANSPLGALGFDADRVRQVMRLSFSRLLEESDAERALDALVEVSGALAGISS